MKYKYNKMNWNGKKEKSRIVLNNLLELNYNIYKKF